MSIFRKIAGSGVSSALKEGTKLIDEIFTTEEERLQGKKQLFEMAVRDRNSARSVYEKDSWLQKAFALFFLVAWCALTWVMLSYFVLDNIKLQDWQIAFVSSVNGGVSTKLSTIIDFLFGGSIDNVNGNKLKNKK